MATETVKPGVKDPVAEINEYPDIVGAKPDNPWLARFTPYIPARAVMRELTPRALIVGTFLGMIFGASSLYLVLKVGLTVSASIPVAVISITLFRLLSKAGMKNATILENNIVQTAGSAGESIAFGVGVTMPAIMILGFDLEITRVMLVSILGGLLGILMMIPLRRALIVQQHGLLKYPEGTACAEVLKVGASDESRAAASDEAKAEMAAAGETNIGAKTIFGGFGIGFLYYVLNKAFYGWKESPEKVFDKPFQSGSISAEVNPALLGVGYIIGPRIASIMCAGGVLAYLVLIPAIKFFGTGAGLLPPGEQAIADMGPNDIRGAYILYIGAGAVAAGGIISLFRSLPTIWHGLKGGIRDLRGGQAAGDSAPRTDQDLSMKFVLIGIIALMAAIILFPQLGLQVNPLVAILGAVMIIAFGFLFVTVSSRLTGEIGSSSNPISGMTVATLLLTCLIFLAVGWTAQNLGSTVFVTALSIGAIVCIASSNGGTTSQDLKTGFLVGATPKFQQIAILIGAFASAIVLGPILLSLNSAYTVYVPPTSLEPMVAQDTPPDKIITLPAGAVTTPYADAQAKPNEPGNYSVFVMRKGLSAGDYLVEESTGKAAYQIYRIGDTERLVPVSESVAPIKTGLTAYDPNRVRPSFYLFNYTGEPKLEGLEPGEYLIDQNTLKISYRIKDGKAEPAGEEAAAVGVTKLGKNVSDLQKYEGPAQPAFSLFTYGAVPSAPAEGNGLGDGDYLINEKGQVAYKLLNNFPADFKADVPAAQLPAEQLTGPQAQADKNAYHSWHKLDPASNTFKRYLVDDQGNVKYMVDPGINGTHKFRPGETTEVTKFDAPKATLMSYIIKGVLDRKLPWGLVLLGVMIAIVLEMSGIPSLAFAVGVYLPLSSSSPIFIGGMVRWLVDRSMRKRLAHKKLSEEQLVAEGDKSPGVLMASGYIAGGAIAGIVIAFMAGLPALDPVNKGLEKWSKSNNPFFGGAYADLLSLIPFLLLTFLLYAVGREWILKTKPRAATLRE
ncbi:MAG TPA: oligopeptide transporter, OPT family [Pyrinomonadaceae bacterium]|jgi:putative OPT family oligopeptide transporter